MNVSRAKAPGKSKKQGRAPGWFVSLRPVTGDAQCVSERGLCHRHATSAVLCPILDSPVQERYGTTGKSPVKGHKGHLHDEEKLTDLGPFSQ